MASLPLFVNNTALVEFNKCIYKIHFQYLVKKECVTAETFSEPSATLQICYVLQELFKKLHSYEKVQVVHTDYFIVYPEIQNWSMWQNLNFSLERQPLNCYQKEIILKIDIKDFLSKARKSHLTARRANVKIFPSKTCQNNGIIGKIDGIRKGDSNSSNISNLQAVNTLILATPKIGCDNTFGSLSLKKRLTISDLLYKHDKIKPDIIRSSPQNNILSYASFFKTIKDKAICKDKKTFHSGALKDTMNKVKSNELQKSLNSDKSNKCKTSQRFKKKIPEKEKYRAMDTLSSISFLSDSSLKASPLRLSSNNKELYMSNPILSVYEDKTIYKTKNIISNSKCKNGNAGYLDSSNIQKFHSSPLFEKCDYVSSEIHLQKYEHKKKKGNHKTAFVALNRRKFKAESERKKKFLLADTSEDQNDQLKRNKLENKSNSSCHAVKFGTLSLMEPIDKYNENSQTISLYQSQSDIYKSNLPKKSLFDIHHKNHRKVIKPSEYKNSNIDVFPSTKSNVLSNQHPVKTLNLSESKKFKLVHEPIYNYSKHSDDNYKECTNSNNISQRFHECMLCKDCVCVFSSPGIKLRNLQVTSITRKSTDCD